MRRSSAVEEEAFLHAEVCELAVLAKECVGSSADRRQPGSVLHTLGVELSVLIGLDDSERVEGLVAGAAQLLAQEGRHDAAAALQAMCSKLQGVVGAARRPSRPHPVTSAVAGSPHR